MVEFDESAASVKSKGYFRVPNDFFRQVDLSGHEKLVYLVMLAWRNNRTGKATPSYTTIAREAGIARRSVKPILDRLEAQGIIRAHRSRNQSGRSQINVYKVALPNLDNTEDEHVGTVPDGIQMESVGAIGTLGLGQLGHSE